MVNLRKLFSLFWSFPFLFDVGMGLSHLILCQKSILNNVVLLKVAAKLSNLVYITVVRKTNSSAEINLLDSRRSPASTDGYAAVFVAHFSKSRLTQPMVFHSCYTEYLLPMSSCY